MTKRKDLKEDGAWSPYVAGALAGLLMVASVWFTGKFFGASTSFVKSAGMIETVFGPERVKTMDYFIKEVPKIDWQWMFVLGIFIGSLLSSTTSKSFHLQAVPDMWRSRFGSGIPLRAAAAFVGGAISMYGARLADG